MGAASQALDDLGPLAGGAHACAFFADEEEEYRALLPFTRDCLDCGERCLNFLHPEHRGDRLARLAQDSIATGEALASGQLELRTWQETTLQDDRFDQDRMLARIDELVVRGAGPFPRTRLWANMEWSLSGLPGCEQLVEFESRVNTVLERSNDIAVCVYDVRRYGASMAMDILRTHPLVVVGGNLRTNALYVPSSSFLPEYRQRRGR
ncbi:MAG: hypothetical protein JWQ76_35 [Ramlibacter sp.]|nr:hypothetical protein [Ramlibacter sp.]